MAWSIRISRGRWSSPTVRSSIRGQPGGGSRSGRAGLRRRRADRPHGRVRPRQSEGSRDRTSPATVIRTGKRRPGRWRRRAGPRHRAGAPASAGSATAAAMTATACARERQVRVGQHRDRPALPRWPTLETGTANTTDGDDCEPRVTASARGGTGRPSPDTTPGTTARRRRTAGVGHPVAVITSSSAAVGPVRPWCGWSGPLHRCVACLRLPTAGDRGTPSS